MKRFNLFFILFACLGLSISEVSAQMQVNCSGGTGSGTTTEVTIINDGAENDASQGVELWITEKGNMQANYASPNSTAESSPGAGDGSRGQFYKAEIMNLDNASSDPTSASTVHGVALVIDGVAYAGGKFLEEAGNNLNHASDDCVGGMSATNTVTFNNTFQKNTEANANSDLYDIDFKMTYEYTKPNTYVDITYEVKINNGNVLQDVVLAHGWDAMLDGGDDSYGGKSGTEGQPGFRVYTTNNQCGYQAIEYLSGTAWSGYYSAHQNLIEDNFNSAPAKRFDNTIDPNIHDSGLAFSVNFGKAQGTHTTKIRLHFADQCQPVCKAPEIPLNNTLTCPGGFDVAGAITSYVPAGYEVRVYDAATGGNLVTSPITSPGTYFVEIHDTNATNCGSSPRKNFGLTGTACIQPCNVGASITAGDTDGDNAICSGETFTLTATSTSTSPTYQWYKDGAIISGETNATYAATAAGSYTVKVNGTGCTEATSTAIVITSQTTGCITAGDGTLDCNKTMVIGMPVQGTASNHTIRLLVNVTTVGQFDVSLSVAGSGFTIVGDSPYKYTATSTGNQYIDVPVKYDGTTALGTVTVNVKKGGTATDITGSPCAIDLTDNTAVKDAVIKVWSKECLPSCGPSLK